jgi:type IV pilus assembly protein PilC
MQQSIKIPSGTVKKVKKQRNGHLREIIAYFTKRSFGKRQLSDKKKELFFAEMGMMLSSGVDVHAALQIVNMEFESKKEVEGLNRITEKLVSGQNLSDAIEGSNLFSPLDISVTRIGENTGQISETFRFLSDYYKRKIKQRNLITSALSYPVFVMLFAMLAVGFLLNNVVPIFSSIYQRFGGELPLVTKLVVGVSERLPIISLILLCALCVAVLSAFSFQKSANFNRITAKVLLLIPGLKNILSVNFIERFCRLMALLINSKVPLIESIGLSKEAIALLPLRSALEKVEHDLFAGLPLWVALEDCKVFPRRVILLVKMGEEINQLEGVFENLAHQYSLVQEKKLKNLGTYLEPILIIIVGILVGLILVAVYMPMFKLGGSIM